MIHNNNYNNKKELTAHFHFGRIPRQESDKVIQHCFGLDSLCPVIGRENVLRSLNQSVPKLKNQTQLGRPRFPAFKALCSFYSEF